VKLRPGSEDDETALMKLIEVAYIEFFHLESFRRLPHGWSGLHFQSLILGKPSSAARRG
jgi:hypothetical protein